MTAQSRLDFDPVNQIYTKPGDPSYERWRPRIRLVAPIGWLNDPCAPFFDQKRGLYHLFYQWNPFGTDWGHMSWGHATSPDMIKWTDVLTSSSGGAALSPDTAYDKDGVFTGCWCPTYPASVEENGGVISVFYTSVNGIIDYPDGSYGTGSETLSYASSMDDGKTWIKHKRNPFRLGPPEHLTATGWRDPYASKYTSLDRHFCPSSPQTYALIAGGEKDVGPTVFLYSFPDSDPLDWKYLGTLLDPKNSQPEGEWAGIPGYNWEVGNLIRLADKDGEEGSKDYLIFGVQFKPEELAKLPKKLRSDGNPQSPGLPQWRMGEIVKVDGGVDFKAVAYGILDYGWYYAANSFEDPKTKRRIVWGWIPDCDLSSERRAEQGWAGCMSLPRVLFPLVILNVASSVSPSYDLASLHNFALQSSSSPSTSLSTFTLETMGIRLAEETKGLFGALPTVDIQATELSIKYVDAAPKPLLVDAGLSWKMSLDLDFVNPTSLEFKLLLCHSPDMQEVTVLNYYPATCLFTLDRSSSTSPPISGINTSSQLAYFSLFNILQPDGIIRPEPLRLTVICDNSVIEIFANDRFAFTSRVYPSRGDSTGISLTARTNVKSTEGEEGRVTVTQCKIWKAK